MHLRGDEKILKTFRHHPFPYIIRVLKVVFYITPFYVLLFLFQNGLSASDYALAFSIITFFFLLVLIYDFFIYWLDRVILTNHRLVHVDWKFFSKVNEHEAELLDIQAINTREQGIFAVLGLNGRAMDTARVYYRQG